ncbi:transcriptional regulator [Mycolicibacterium chubuense NBB4]|uniref:Transcriptional regulator n=1 Tax=Mycolicibacterium chubuense (strain NBB4) TaxID=710421 RepID=I4BCY1_MYCCN|nr:TetR/AcrR family transcriptional regulator [Mycolicibacterium chubuense]AFM15138.1 transcriptional regulator [Mycolicibacterium chubuense NBB4]
MECNFGGGVPAGRPESKIGRVDTRRKHNPIERRRQLCDAAIALLAEEGPRGLSHLKVDRRAAVADGTTSFYYRTRAALLHGVADQLVRYDAEAFTEAFKDAPNSSGAEILTMLARQVLLIREEPQLSRTRARLELTMLAKRDADIAAEFQQMSESYRALVERMIVAMQSNGGTLDRSLCDEQASVVLTYLGGLIFALANDSPDETSQEDVARQIRAIITGVAAEHGCPHR